MKVAIYVKGQLKLRMPLDNNPVEWSWIMIRRGGRETAMKEENGNIFAIVLIQTNSRPAKAEFGREHQCQQEQLLSVY